MLWKINAKKLIMYKVAKICLKYHCKIGNCTVRHNHWSAVILSWKIWLHAAGYHNRGLFSKYNIRHEVKIMHKFQYNPDFKRYYIFVYYHKSTISHCIQSGFKEGGPCSPEKNKKEKERKKFMQLDGRQWFCWPELNGVGVTTFFSYFCLNYLLRW